MEIKSVSLNVLGIYKLSATNAFTEPNITQTGNVVLTLVNDVACCVLGDNELSHRYGEVGYRLG